MQRVEDGIYHDLEEFNSKKMMEELLRAREQNKDVKFEIIPPHDFERAKQRVGKKKIQNGNLRKKTKRYRKSKAIVD